MKRYILLIGCLIGYLAGLPATYQLLGETLTARAAFTGLIGSAIGYWLALIFGIPAAEQMGLRIFVSDKEETISQLIIPGIIGGLVIGGVIIGIESFIFKPLLKEVALIPGGMIGALQSLGAINAEVIGRLLYVSLLSLGLTKIGIAKRISIPLAIIIVPLVVSAFLLAFFGYMPQYGPFKALSQENLGLLKAYALLGTLFDGIAFGWLYWRYNLATAILAHWIALLMSNMVVPLLI